VRRALGIAIALALLSAAPAQAVPAWRGIIEGAYGSPWIHAARMRILDWMPSHGFKQYIHAPKEDPYQRPLWRTPYPADQMQQFDYEIEEAQRLHLQWIPNLSPGVPQLPTPLPPGTQASAPLCFSCPEDVQAVVDKFQPFLDAGVRTVMVSFDDVDQGFARPEDTAAFGAGPGAYGTATASFLNRVYDALQADAPGTQLLTVTSDYAGTADSPYLQGLRAALRPAIQVMWTGTRVRSTQWTAADAHAYAALIGRTPIVWDNWTNNDFVTDPEDDAQSARLFLGPYIRPASVARSVAGWFFNPASEADINMLPLATAGAWVHNPYRYNARRSWLEAVGQLAGPDPVREQALRAFAETSYSTRLSRIEGPTFVRLSNLFLGAYDAGPYWTRALYALRNELGLAHRAPSLLAGIKDRPFFEQAIPFIDAASDSAAAGVVGSTLLEAERPSLSAEPTLHGGFRLHIAAPVPGRAAMLRDLLARWRAHLASLRRLVYGWRPVAGLARPSYAPRNVLDTFLDSVDRHDAAWQPLAEQAASGVVVSVDGRPGPPPLGGIVNLSGRNCSKLVIARDGAGGQTSLRLPPCRRR
jgi:hyaluronoglucosaminidase